MILLCNRFALIPHMCDSCKRYVWMESYREADVWEPLINEYLTETFCMECAQKIIKGEVDNSGRI